MAAASPGPATGTLLFVYDEGRWLATPPGGRDPIVVDPDDLPVGPGVAPPPATGPDPTDIVSAAGPVVLRSVPDGPGLAAAHPRTGEAVVLDRIDVALLALDRPTAVDELYRRAPDGAPRTARLIDAGLLLVTPGPASLEPDQAEPADVAPSGAVPAPADRTRRLSLSRLRRRHRGGGLRPGEPVPDGVGTAPAPLPALDPAPVSEEERLRRAHRGPTDAGAPRTSTATNGAAPAPGAPSGRTRVLAAWDVDQWGQALALGGLLAYLRVAPGDLDSVYDIRRVATHEEVIAELERDTTPAVVLLSSYMWSVERNLETTRAIGEMGPHLVVHGGPHVPKYEGEIRHLFEAHPAVGVIVHGEGELTLADVLRTLDGDIGDLGPLASVPGLTHRTEGGTVTTGDRPRHDQLEDFPSPYLAGEFDHLDTSGWLFPSVETDRGCPYSCTYCDWGSATRSRIRMFPIERVLGDLDWLADHGLSDWMINDANFGIHSRDVDITQHVVDLRQRTGFPRILYLNYAKNTVRHLVDIIGMLVRAGIMAEGALALQTWDPDTLRAVKRSNIKLEAYDTLREEFVRHGLPLVTDLIVGLPGQTVQSFLDDLQMCVDREITPRFFVALNLPNAEMNAPEYRNRFRLVMGEGDVVVESSTFSRDDRERMMRLRMAFRCFEHFGILRHVLRYAQWDHGVPAAEAIDRIEAVVHASPERYPLISWVLGYLDIFLAPPFGWEAFYDEVAQLLDDEFAIARTSALDTVLAVQQALMPARGRRLPARVDLAHDYVAWFAQHRPDGTGTPLADRGPGVLEVEDTTDRCRHGITRLCEARPPELVATPFWMGENWELRSPVARQLTVGAAADADARPDDTVTSGA